LIFSFDYSCSVVEMIGVCVPMSVPRLSGDSIVFPCTTLARSDVAADVQAGVATEEVPAVVHPVVLGDLDVAAAATGRGQRERAALVGAALVVLDAVDHARILLGLHDLPAALAHAGDLGVVVDAGADA